MMVALVKPLLHLHLCLKPPQQTVTSLLKCNRVIQIKSNRNTLNYKPGSKT